MTNKFVQGDLVAVYDNKIAGGRAVAVVQDGSRYDLREPEWQMVVIFEEGQHAWAVHPKQCRRVIRRKKPHG